LLAFSFALPAVIHPHPSSASRVRVYENVLPARMLSLIETDVRAIATHEIGKSLKDNKKVTRWFPSGATPRTAMEEAIVRLRKIVKPGKSAGAEWWVQKVGVTDPIGFHLDKDESVASNKHYLVHPMWASILYLTNNGGGTLIFDQYSPNGNGYEPEQPVYGEYVFPKPNKYTIFQGHLLHGVVPGKPSTARERLTFLINFWNEKPAAPNCDFLNHTDVVGLKLLNATELRALRAELDGNMSPSKHRRVSLSRIELTRPSGNDASTAIGRSSSGPIPVWTYDFRLPGNLPAKVLLPANPDAGASYTLQWKDPQKAKQDL